MRIMHIALGGCLKAPPVAYGITEDTGGHITYILGAAEAQIARPEVTQVDIVTRAFDDAALGSIHRQAEEVVAPGLRILRLRTANTRYAAKEDLASEVPALTEAFLTMLAERGCPDLIHAHFGDAAQLAMAAAERFGVRWVYTPHALGLDKRRMMGRGGLDRRIAWERSAIKGADAIIASTRDEAERQVRAYDPNACARTHVVPPGINPERDGEVLPLFPAGLQTLGDPRKPIILAIARPVEKKNLTGLLAAYAGSPDLQRMANLVIVAGQARDGVPRVGEEAGVLNRLRAMVETAGLDQKVALPAQHTRADVRALYALAARRGVFVNPAIHEPFGLTFLEAAAAGAPVVVTQNGGPPDIARRLGTGALVDPYDAAAIAEACREALTNPAIRAAAGRARGNVAEHFSWAAWAARVAAILSPDRHTRARPATAL
ncbi:MAG: glycosyltransferase, partial [Shimia sp.]